MLRDSLPGLREWATEVGATWREVCQLKNELIEQERQARYETDDVRRRAWELYCWQNMTDGCRSFWRCGWDHVRQRLDRLQLDFTSIRGYDKIHQQIVEEFPWWRGDRCEELFDWLLHTPYEPWPPREDFYARAIARFEAINHNTSTTDPALDDLEY